MKPVSRGRGGLIGEQDAPNDWQLEADSLPPMEVSALPAARVVRASGIDLPGEFPNKVLSIRRHAKVSILLDQSQLTTAYPVLVTAAGRGSIIRLTYAEALVDAKGKKGNRNQIEGKHIVGLVDEFLPGGLMEERFM